MNIHSCDFIFMFRILNYFFKLSLTRIPSQQPFFVKVKTPFPQTFCEHELTLDEDSVENKFVFSCFYKISDRYPTSFQRRRLINQANAKSKSEKFPPPHQDGSLGFPMDPLNQEQSFEASDASFTSTTFTFPKAPAVSWSGPIANPVTTGPAHRSSAFISKLTSAGFPMGIRKDKVDGARIKGKERVSEVFGGGGNL